MVIEHLNKVMRKVIPTPVKVFLKSALIKGKNSSNLQSGQDLDVYWDEEMAQILEIWGEENVWKEIKLLMVNCEGKVLDIACGPGKTMEVLAELPFRDTWF